LRVSAPLVGLIFDVDGVIADTESVNAEASITMLRDCFGIQGVTREDFEEGIGRGAEAYVQAAARRHGRVLSADELKTATRVRQENFLSILRERPLPPFPGVLDLIHAALEQPGRFCAAIATSSTREKSMAVLRAAGVPVERLAYVCGDDVEKKKPAPSLFLEAARRMSVPPERCVVFEDAPDGIQAAKAAGAKCIAVTNSFPRERLAAADLVVNSLADVSVETLEHWFP